MPAAQTGDVPASPSPPFTVLVVCTGNICRSALAERLARAYLDEVLGTDAHAIRVASAGTRAVVGSAMHPDSALVLRGLGGDPDGFRARRLRPELVEQADLVLAMTARHREAVLAQAPAALRRTFLLREAADLATTLPADVPGNERDPAAQAAQLVGAMAGARGRRPADPGDDVPDPIGRPLEVHDRVGALVAEALLPLLDQLVALDPSASPSARS